MSNKLAVEKEKNAKRMGFKPFVSAQAAFTEAPGAPRKRVSATAKAN